MNRREFFVHSGIAGMLASSSRAQTAHWFDRPMRWAQLAFVEDDPGKFDPAFWLDYFKRTHSDGVCLSAGGCVAFYPTKIPLHHRSKWLGDSDPFGRMVDGCRKLGMAVIARTDPHSILQDAADAHPDWIHVTADGQKRWHWATPQRWVTCALGPYNFEFMTEVTREIVELYGVDGVFSNRWAGHGTCYCESCKRNFKAATGFEIPRTESPQDPGSPDRAGFARAGVEDPARRAYIGWRQRRLFELWDVWDGAIRKVNPNARFIANAGGGALSNLDMKTIGERASILFADRQARRGLMPPWANGKNAKEYRATLGRKPIGAIFSVGIEEPYRWKDSVQTGEEIKVWVADAVANGMRPWFVKFNAQSYDRRWMKPVEEIYNWHWRNEKYLRNEEPLARVGLVYSQQTATFYGGQQARTKVEDHTMGFYHALIEARIPFEMVHDGLLAPERISRLRTLLLPNIAALSDAQCAQIRSFVENGGSVVATFETSLYDEWGNRRSEFGLADLFGASFGGRVEGPMQNSYLTIEKDRAHHPLLRGLEDTPRIIHGVRRVHTVARDKQNSPLTLVPSYPDLPMEEVYPRTPRTDQPEVYVRQIGRGRVVFFPWDVDRTFWEVMSTDHFKLLRNAVLWATNEDAPVTVAGPGVLDVTLWRQRNSLTIHLVNLTNPMMMKGPIREIIPVGMQKVSVRLPADVRVTGVKLLERGEAVPYRQSAGRLELDVPSIRVHEVVAVDVA